MNQVPPRSPEAVDRLKRRYPRSRVPRPVAIALLAVVALVGLGWLIWAGYVHATPQVEAQVATYVVKDDRRVAVALTVVRRDPTIGATCRVVAQATDFETVGEVEVVVPPASDRVTNLAVDLITLRRATTAVAKECRIG